MSISMSMSMSIFYSNLEEAEHFIGDHVILLSSLTAAGISLFLFRRWCTGGVCKSKRRLDGKTVLITGANTGIGKETAKDLATRGARVILACRDILKAERARQDIIRVSGNGNIVIRQLDLASLNSVRQFANIINKEEKHLDILINNAGVMRCPHWTTEDGFEYQFGVNHLGHFLLTNLLLEKLKQSSPTRIINVSSNAYKRRKGFIDFSDINWEQRPYDDWGAYAQSKLANILFTRELSRRLQGERVTVNALHPGVIRTELGRHFWPGIPLWRKVLTAPLVYLIFKSPAQGAQTSIYCAVDESVEGVSGKFFSDCAIKALENVEHSENDEDARKLWEISEQLVGLNDAGAG